MRVQCSKCRALNAFEIGDLNSEFACGRCQEPMRTPAEVAAPGVAFGDFILREQLVKRTHETDFIADQVSLQRPAVVKVLNPELSSKQAFITQFFTAARESAKLCHPNISPIYTVGCEEGIYYLVHELGEATTLKRNLLDKGVMTWQGAAQVVIDIARGLDFAWSEKRLMHCNLKPDYILVGYKGGSRLCDAGVAGLDPEEDSERIIGTPQYLAPERIVGMGGDNRADLYSLGVTFFFMVTGEFPFMGDSTNDIISKHLQEFPRQANQVVAEIPQNICGVIDMLLEKNPNNRYQTGAMLGEDLQAILQGGPPPHAAKRGQVVPSSATVLNAQEAPMKPGTLRVRTEDAGKTGHNLRSNANSEKSTVIKVTNTGQLAKVTEAPAPALAIKVEPPNSEPTTAPAVAEAQPPAPVPVAVAAPAPAAPAPAAPAPAAPAPAAPAPAAPAPAAPAPALAIKIAPAVTPDPAGFPDPVCDDEDDFGTATPLDPSDSSTRHDPKKPMRAIIDDDDDEDAQTVVTEPVPAPEAKKKAKKKRTGTRATTGGKKKRTSISPAFRKERGRKPKGDAPAGDAE